MARSTRNPRKKPKKRRADAAGDSSDPVRLYLKEMGNFQLLSREQEVEIAKRIEAGEQEVEEEVLKSPVTLDFLIDLGDRIEAGEADLRDIFEESEEPADPDEERGPEANEKLLKKLHDSTKKLKDLRAKLEELEEELRERPGPRRKPKLERNYARMRERVKAAFITMGLSRHVREAVIAEMRHQLDAVPPGLIRRSSATRAPPAAPRPSSSRRRPRPKTGATCSRSTAPARTCSTSRPASARRSGP